MSASLNGSTVATSVAPNAARTIGTYVAIAIGPVLLLLSLLGPGWVHVPANPVAKTPATTMSFADLHDLVSSGVVPTTGVQEAYYDWLAWTLASAAVLAAVLLAVTDHGITAGVLLVVGALGLVFTALAVKGVQTWGHVFDQLDLIRLGGCLVIIGFLAVLLSGVVGLIRARRPR